MQRMCILLKNFMGAPMLPMAYASVLEVLVGFIRFKMVSVVFSTILGSPLPQMNP